MLVSKLPWLIIAADRLGLAIAGCATAGLTTTQDKECQGSMAMSERTYRFDRPVNILITGDSMTHGQEGDFTWRYRLWSWLKETAGPSCRFVGPYQGTHGPAPEPHGPQPPDFYNQTKEPDVPRLSGGYALDCKQEFLSECAHMSSWGKQARQVVPEIGEQVRKHSPDIVLVALGFNDMAWFVSDWVGTLASIAALVEEIQKARTETLVVVGTVPRRTPLQGREDLERNVESFNRELRAAISGWVNVSLAEMEKEYDCSVGAYDGLHPNALGEWQIAKAYADALSRINVRHESLQVPVAVDSGEYLPQTPANVSAESSPMGVKVTWNPVYGSRGYDTRTRLKNESSWSEGHTDMPRLDVTFTVPKLEWEVQIRASRGDAEKYKSPWSPVQTAVSGRIDIPDPDDVHVQPVRKGLQLSWKPPLGIDVDRYEISLQDIDVPNAFPVAWCWRSPVALIEGLDSGHTYNVWISAWILYQGELVAGLPYHVGSFMPDSDGGSNTTVKSVKVIMH